MTEKAEYFLIFILVDERASWSSSCVQRKPFPYKESKERIDEFKNIPLSRFRLQAYFQGSRNYFELEIGKTAHRQTQESWGGEEGKESFPVCISFRLVLNLFLVIKGILLFCKQFCTSFVLQLCHFTPYDTDEFTFASLDFIQFNKVVSFNDTHVK